MKARDYETISAVVFVVGLYEGVLPFAAKLFGFSPALSLPARMEPPAWWVVSGLVVAVGLVLLAWLDRAKDRAAAAAAEARTDDV